MHVFTFVMYAFDCEDSDFSQRVMDPIVLESPVERVELSLLSPKSFQQAGILSFEL